jgi:transcriptional regulator with XRE-family HTH domain
MITPGQCRAARALLDLTQPQLAEASNISLRTIVNFEKGNRATNPGSIALIERALEAAGVEFIAENGGGAGVRLAKAKRRTRGKG